MIPESVVEIACRTSSVQAINIMTFSLLKEIREIRNYLLGCEGRCILIGEDW